jgi:phosphoribosylanthranilate isomerase
MPRTRIKICGITRPQDAALAAELGADAIGLNFVGGPRQISIRHAHLILPEVPLFVLPVALVKRAADASELWSDHDVRTFQVYGRDVVLHIRRSMMELYGIWGVLPVTSRDFLALNGLLNGPREIQANDPSLDEALVLDTASPTQLGGTGQTFNWHWIAEAREAGELKDLPPIILAGGLTPDNVADAIRIARPYAVDVSSGVEVAGKPGIKDPVKMRDFIQAVQGVS